MARNRRRSITSVGLRLTLVMLTVFASGVPAKADPTATEPRRIALVIGNADYQNYPPLPNVTNDVTDMTSALKALHFDVTVAPERQTMSELVLGDIMPFADAIQEGDIVVIYYSGHGFSFGSESYLVPVGASASVKANKLSTTFPPISAIQSLIENQNPGLVLMIFDACRSIGTFVEPDPATGPAKGFGIELAPPSNIWVAYGSAPGLPAGAGAAGSKSIFTQALVNRIGTPGKELSDIQKLVLFDVKTATDGAQKPWYSDSRTVSLWLAPTDAERAEELQQWQAHLALGTVDAMREFLAFYGVGAYAAAAREWLAKAAANRLAATGSSPTSVPALLPETAWQSGQPNVRVATFASLAFPAATDVSAAPSLTALQMAVKADALAFQTVAVTRKTVKIREDDVPVPSVVDPTRDPREIDDGSIIVSGSSDPYPMSPNRKLEKGSALTLGPQLGMKRAASRSLGDNREDIAIKLKPSEIALGRPTLEMLVSPDPAGSGTVVDAAAVTAALERAREGGRTVSWVSVSTARDDADQVELERRMLGTQARYAVTQAGVAASQVTMVNGLPESFEGVRLRIYTK